MIAKITQFFHGFCRVCGRNDERMIAQAADCLYALGKKYHWWKPSPMDWRDFDPADRAEFLAAAESIMRAGRTY